jgi:hypothetical protein
LFFTPPLIRDFRTIKRPVWTASLCGIPCAVKNSISITIYDKAAYKLFSKSTNALAQHSQANLLAIAEEKSKAFTDE